MFLRNILLVICFLTFANSLPTSISTDAETESELSQGPLIAEDKFQEIEIENKGDDAQIEGQLFFRDKRQAYNLFSKRIDRKIAR